MEEVVIVGEADVTEADLAHVVTQLPDMKKLWVLPVVVAIGVVPFVIRSWPDWKTQVLTVLLPMLFLVVMATLFQRGGKGAWVKQALANVGGPTTFRFDDYGFTWESSLRQHRLAWAGLARSLETPLAFLVYTTPRTVLVVPKRAFRDEDVAKLSGLLSTRITPQPGQKIAFFGTRSAQRRLFLWVVLVAAFLAIWRFLDDGKPTHRAHPRRPAAAEPASSDEPSDVDSSR